MSVTSPGSLRAAALADACTAVNATLVWASPAALRSALATASSLTPLQRRSLEGVRLLMSAGAPVPASLLEQAASVMPNAEPHTPYGMTEVLPVADISLVELRAAGAGVGVCVGRPVPGVELRIDPLASGSDTGEILVRAPHGKDRYDRLWATQSATFDGDGWHRTGDVGHLDAEGRLWVEGRLAHIISTNPGPLTPVPLEMAAEGLAWVQQAAAVGVGPEATQQVVVVAVPTAAKYGLLASLEQIDDVRAAAPEAGVAAVLLRDELPVDRRHNSKIDRTALAAWASNVLSGGRP
jgi:acyl-coenzyme A synthetase/AMP-(fatty) acid ligase